MKKAVSSLFPKTAANLRRIIAEVWNSFSQQTIDDLVLSFFHRLQLVIDTKGESIQNFIQKGMSHSDFVFNQPPESAVFIENVIRIIREEDEVEILPPQIKNENNMTDLPFTEEEEETILRWILKFGKQ